MLSSRVKSRPWWNLLWWARTARLRSVSFMPGSGRTRLDPGGSGGGVTWARPAVALQARAAQAASRVRLNCMETAPRSGRLGDLFFMNHQACNDGLGDAAGRLPVAEGV